MSPHLRRVATVVSDLLGAGSRFPVKWTSKSLLDGRYEVLVYPEPIVIDDERVDGTIDLTRETKKYVMENLAKTSARFGNIEATFLLSLPGSPILRILTETPEWAEPTHRLENDGLVPLPPLATLWERIVRPDA